MENKIDEINFLKSDDIGRFKKICFIFIYMYNVCIV